MDRKGAARLQGDEGRLIYRRRANPNGGLVLVDKGVIYGTTPSGGYNCPHNSGQGCGTVFRLTPPADKGGGWSESILHRFKATPDGSGPQSGVIIEANGGLCGTTGGGPWSWGIVFCLEPPSGKSGRWEEKILYGFNDNNQYGADPVGGLTLGSDGNLYGTTNAFGAYFGGTVFELKPKGAEWQISLLYSFTGPPDAEFPAAELIFDKSGNFYSTSQAGGNGQPCQSGCGTVFEVSPYAGWPRPLEEATDRTLGAPFFRVLCERAGARSARLQRILLSCTPCVWKGPLTEWT